jgi:hypothetical protein
VAQKPFPGLNRVNDIAEHVADRGPEDRQNDDDDDGHQNENQSILYEALAFLKLLEHGFPPFLKNVMMMTVVTLSVSSYILRINAINKI